MRASETAPAFVAILNGFFNVVGPAQTSDLTAMAGVRRF